MLRRRALALLFSTALMALTGGNPAGAQAAATAAPAAPRPVDVRIWLSGDDLHDEGVTLWVAVQNAGPAAVRNFQFESLDTPGLEHVGPCWRDAWTTPACAAGGEASVGWPTIPAGSTEVRWADVRRSAKQASSRKIVVSGVWRWIEAGEDGADAAPGVVQTAASIAGPFTLAANHFYNSDYVNDLALPASIALAGFFVQLFLRRRAERQAIWERMIEKAHRDAERHYMPISAAAGVVVEQTAKYFSTTGEKKDDALDQTLFYLIVFNGRLRDLRQQAGGFYLKLLSAETVISQAWVTLKRAQNERLDKVLMDQAVGAIHADMPFGEFQRRRRTATGQAPDELVTTIAQIRTALQAWMHTSSFTPEVVTPLRLIEVVFDTEINRPFAPWYGTQPTIRTAELTGLADSVRTCNPKLAKAVEDYLDDRWQWLPRPARRVLGELRRGLGEVRRGALPPPP